MGFTARPLHKLFAAEIGSSRSAGCVNGRVAMIVSN
jgi:hypothetical protein